MTVVDLFAGPGGMDLGARMAGVDPVGVELDSDACTTRAANGLCTIRADVRSVELRGRIDGLLASPPCPTFSQAGSGAGVRELPQLVDHVHRCVSGWRPYTPPRWADERSALALEPLRWSIERVPTWLVLEQVPPVLPLWEAYRYVLGAHGWNVWCGVLAAERYGVPQTRDRAFLIAHRTRPVGPPAPTHQQYEPDVPAAHEYTLLGELAPWVSMAEALGWGMTDRPYPVLASGRDSGGGPDREKVGGSGAREIIYAERDAGRWCFERPATTIAGDHRCWPPGHKINDDDRRRIHDADERYGDRRGSEAIRLSLRDALALQSFPADFVVYGSKTSQFAQIGNAVPPLVARAVISEAAR